MAAAPLLPGQNTDHATAAPVPKASAAPPAAPTPQTTWSSVNVDGPYIAMTFDDGPHTTLTPKLLDLLASRHLKATFFVVGENAAQYPEIMKRAVREGHEIGNHSWSHPNFGKMNDEAVRRELQRTDEAIANAIGTHPVLMRPPYGSITARQKHWIHDDFHYNIILWDVDPLDWKRPGPSVVARRILKETRAGSIVLSHDIHAGTIEAMPETLDGLIAKGFKFVTVSELLRMAKPGPRPEPEPSVKSAAPAADAPVNSVAPAPPPASAPSP